MNLQISSCLACATLTMLRVWMLLVVGAAGMRQAAEDVSAHSAVKEEWTEKSLRKDVEWVAKKKFPEEDRHHLIEAVMKAFKSEELSPGRANGIEAALQQKHEELIRLKGLVDMAWEDIPEEERHHLTEAAMNEWMNGELDKSSIKGCWEEKVFPNMQQMRQDFELLQRQVERVAKENFPEEERHRLTTAVMNAWEKRELEQDLNKPEGGMSSDASKDREEYLVKTMQELRELPVVSAVKFQPAPVRP